MNSYKIKITPEIAEAAVYGGVFLGGGGGGALETGLQTAFAALALGELYLVSLANIDENSNIITASAVGSPASKEGYVTAEHCRRALELYRDFFNQEIAGVVTNENGGHSTTNGWVLSAVTGLPLIDAPCNGRAHPTGQMGSMGLSMDPSYISCQVAVGGKKETGRYTEIAVKGRLEAASRLVRRAAVESGGLVTVLRNSVKAQHLSENAAPGALRQAIEIGKVFMENRGSCARIIRGISKLMPVTVLAEGPVSGLRLEIKDGFDVGALKIKDLEIAFWNEYMTVEKAGERFASFPDLMVTLDRRTGQVKTSAQLTNDDEIILLKVSKTSLLLGKGMYDRKLFEEVEAIINKLLIPYHFNV